MKQDKAYIVKWFGPFFSREELEDWEVLHDFKSQLYLLHGKKKYAKTRECYYCGMTTRTAYKRFKDANHHIGEIENRDHNIYVGHFTNLIPSAKDIKLVEKLLTSYLDYFIGRKALLNKRIFMPQIAIMRSASSIVGITVGHDENTNEHPLILRPI